jgi:integrase
MLGLYTGLRREEILGLQWDCVFMDDETPYLSVRRAWRSVNNRPEVSTLLKTPAANRDIPIPKVLVDCLRKAKEKSKSDYVISDSEGNPLSGSQYRRMWQYVEARSTKERTIYRYINGERIHRTIKPKLGQRCRTNKTIYYTLDFKVTPHILRYTYITNLIHEGVDPKTVQYLAGHENSKVTMDIYARVKYNKPWELSKVVNDAFGTASECSET